MVWSYRLDCESSREAPRSWYLVASVCFNIESAILEIIPTSSGSRHYTQMRKKIEILIKA